MNLHMFQMTTKVVRMTTPIEISRRISDVIRDAAKAAGVSQRELSEMTGIPLVTLNRKLNHSSSFTTIELGSISDALNISLVEIAVRAERQKVPA